MTKNVRLRTADGPTADQVEAAVCRVFGDVLREPVRLTAADAYGIRTIEPATTERAQVPVFEVGDRVESTSGDDKGSRGTVTKIDPSDQTPIHWTADNGSLVRCVAERIRHVYESRPASATLAPAGDRDVRFAVEVDAALAKMNAYLIEVGPRLSTGQHSQIMRRLEDLVLLAVDVERARIMRVDLAMQERQLSKRASASPAPTQEQPVPAPSSASAIPRKP